MFYPEFRYLIQQDNGEMINWIENELFAGLIVVGVNLCVLISSSYILFHVMKTFCKFSIIILYTFWNLLTPGNELIEIGMIIASLFTLYYLFKLFYELTNIIDNNFNKLKGIITERNLKIKKLEEEICVKESKLKKVEASLNITELNEWRQNMGEIFPEHIYIKQDKL